jgi:hypothetical protein
VYIPPFNLIEVIFVAPFEFVVSPATYDKMNRVVMSVVFCIPLTLVALFESQLNLRANSRLKQYFEGGPEEDEDDETLQDPDCEDDDEGDICRVKFKDLVKVFPK